MQHNSERQRFEARLADRLAYMTYSFAGNSVVFDHTFVPEEFRGKGVAATLVREALEQARRQNWNIIPSCPYVATFIERHPEFADLVT